MWYTCKRNGTPADLLRYEGPILLSKSCALVYFGYVDTENESKIMRTDYTIFYSDDIRLETNDEILSLLNTGSGTVDIGGWSVIAGTGAISVPPGTTVLPGSSYVIGKVEPNSYSLTSPEGYMKGQVAIAPAPVSKPKAVAAIVPKKHAIARPVAETTSTGTANGSGTTDSQAGTMTPQPAATLASSQVPEQSKSPQPITNGLKASATESGNNNSFIVFAVLGLLVAGGVAVQFVKRG